MFFGGFLCVVLLFGVDFVEFEMLIVNMVCCSLNDNSQMRVDVFRQENVYRKATFPAFLIEVYTLLLPADAGFLGQAVAPEVGRYRLPAFRRQSSQLHFHHSITVRHSPPSFYQTLITSQAGFAQTAAL